MKKLNSVFFISIIFILVAVFTGIAGCKSLPKANLVNPVELLDGNSDFYVAIPKNADSEFVRLIIQKSIPGLSENNIDKVFERTSEIYCGLSSSNGSNNIQAAIKGDVPKTFMGSLLTKRNGWQIRDFMPENSIVPHVIYTGYGIDLSFPSGNIACVGRDIDEMLKKYDLLAFTPEIVQSVSDINNKESGLPVNIYNYLIEGFSEIRFYSGNPLFFLTALTGRPLDLKIIDVKGGFSINENNPDQYILNVEFNFKESKFLKAGKSLLSFAFGLNSSQVKLIGDTGLKIEGIKINRNILYRLFEL